MPTPHVGVVMTAAAETTLRTLRPPLFLPAAQAGMAVKPTAPHSGGGIAQEPFVGTCSLRWPFWMPLEASFSEFLCKAATRQTPRLS